MKTFYDLSLDVARIVIPDMLVDGEVTASATTSITDTENIVQQDEHFSKGILWINSGTYSGRVIPITTHFGNKVNWATALAGAPATGVLFTIAPRVYSLPVIRAKIMQALYDTYVEDEDDTLTGDGETLEFTLPTGVYDIKRVRIEHPTDATNFYYSSHWKPKNGKIKFDYGFAPEDNYKVVLIHAAQHDTLSSYNSEVNHEIDTNWLKLKAAEYLLDYGMGKYGGQKEYRIEERMNFVREKLVAKSPRRSIDVTIRSAGMPSVSLGNTTRNP